VHVAALTAPEQRVLGCLIEKRFTTPDSYPLSLNALRLACNQSTNRDPVTDYDEATVRGAAQRLCTYGLARLASGHSSRAIKYRHLAEDALGLGRAEQAMLAVLLLRGPQTPGELKGRTERMVELDSLADVQRVLEQLSERGYLRSLGRRPGQKEDRFAHLFGEGGGDAEASSPGAAPETLASTPPSSPDGDLATRVAALERQPTMIPASVISAPAAHQVRSVTSDLAAPTRKWAAIDTIAAATIAAVPVVIMNGITGMIAPAAVLNPAAVAAWTGSPVCSAAPNSSAARTLSIASGCVESCSAISSAVFSSIPFSW
jgi:uncharacterized protein YceH (UPF0502 family)